MKKHQIQDKKKGISIFLKIAVLFELVMIVSLVFITAFSTESFMKILKQKEIALGEDRITNLADLVQEEYNRIYSLGNYIHSGDVSEIMTRIDNDESQAYEYDNISVFQTFFHAVSYADDNISDVILVSMHGNVYSYTRQASYEINPSYDFLDDPDIKKFLASDDSMTMLYEEPTKYCIRKREPVVSFIGKIFDASLFPQKKQVGIYIMNLPLTRLDEVQNISTEEGQGESFLLNRAGEILYCTDHSRCGAFFEAPQGREKSRVYISSRKLGLSGLQLTYILSESIMFSQVIKVRMQIGIILGIAIAVTMFIYYIIYSVFQKRMNSLLQSMQKLQSGDFSTRLDIRSQDEIGRISASFNEMCEQLNIYVSKVYQSEIQRKNAEINALQTQINPHFLYNTLESIKAEALLHNDTETAEMIALLGNLFRWSCRAGERTVSLDEELSYVRDYLTLQSYRFNRNLEISMEVDDSLLDYAVPKLILQPIVENVIKYALSDVERSRIVGIQARKKEGNLELTVYDNGRGITPEKLDQIREGLQQDAMQGSFESIGLRNVNQRLTLMFGSEYRLEINSKVDFGTAVKVRIPALTKKEMNQNAKNAQNADCR